MDFHYLIRKLSPQKRTGTSNCQRLVLFKKFINVSTHFDAVNFEKEQSTEKRPQPAERRLKTKRT